MFLTWYQKVSSYTKAKAEEGAKELLYLGIQSRVASGIRNEGTRGMALAAASLPRKARRWFGCFMFLSYSYVKPSDEVRKEFDIVSGET